MNPENLSLIKYLRSAYPGAEIEDYFKSLYQSVFGPDGAEMNEAGALKFLEDEKAGLSPRHEDPFIEPLGKRFSRVYLSKAVATNLSPRTFVRLHLLSTKAPKGDQNEFLSSLFDLEKAIPECGLPFGPEEFSAFFASYEKGGFGPLRHGDFYKRAYNPHYLLLSRPLAELIPYYIQIDENLLLKADVALYLKSLPYSISSQIFDNWLFVYPETKRPAAL